MLKQILCIAIVMTIEINCDNGNNLKKPERQKQIKLQLPTNVAVIGGGIAGLAAARSISKNRANFTVTVFEAQKDRFGGRIWTDKLKDLKAKGVDVDLGASALNTVSKSNPLIQLAEDFELKTASLEGLQFIVPWQGKVFSSGADISEITRDAAQILSSALDASRSLELESSVREAVDKVLLEGKVVSPDSPGAHLVRCLPSYVIKDYSTRNYRPELLDVGYEKVLMDGIGELVDRLVSGSSSEPPLHLELNKAVRQVKVDRQKGEVLLRFRDGSSETVDKVVIGVPASVLAAHDVVFEPELPDDYRLALQEMGIANSNKVIVEFQHMFWPADVGIFLRAVQGDDGLGFMQSWLNIHRFVKRPVLATFITGDTAVTFEALSDDEVKSRVMETLVEMFGKEVVSQGGNIVKIQRSSWVTDEFFKGSHTYPKVGTSPSLWNKLSSPLCPFVYFVGEHTTFEDHGTLHGAYNSGLRAGDQILGRFCEKKEEEEQRLREERRKKKEEEEKKKKENKDSVKKVDDEL